MVGQSKLRLSNCGEGEVAQPSGFCLFLCGHIVRLGVRVGGGMTLSIRPVCIECCT